MTRNGPIIKAIAAALAAALGLPTGQAWADTPMEDAVNRAYHAFSEGHYANARQLLLPFDGRAPRTIRLDFMLGVSNCRVKRIGDGRMRLQNILRDYVIKRKSIENDIRAQLADCETAALPVAGLDGKADGGINAKTQPADAQSSSAPQMSGLEYGWSYNQGDIFSTRASSPLQCAEICLANSKCRAMTFIESQKLCWIKDRIPTKRGQSSDMTSAVKLGGVN